MEVLPSDTILGCRIHINSNDKNNAFDYYYDGQKTIEVRHNTKEILVINPYTFPNNENNPARARTAFRPFLPLLIKKDLVNTLLDKGPHIGLQQTTRQWIIILAYPKNQYNAQTTDTLYISKSTLLPVRTGRITYWNGTTYKAAYVLDYIAMNNKNVSDSIGLTTSWPAYQLKKFERPGKQTADTIHLTGKQAPDFTYPTFDGRTVSLHDLKGRYVLLDFWETWCGYCILALPTMKELYNKYHDKGLEIIGITTENEKQIARIIDKNQLPYTHLKGTPSILRDYHIIGRPGYVLINREGKIIEYDNWENIEKFIKGL
jgi:peroxiredoxin